MPVISAHMVKKPRAAYLCGQCREVIDHAPHVVAFGYAETGDKPSRIRVCMDCASFDHDYGDHSPFTTNNTTVFLVAMKFVGERRTS